MKVTIFRGGEIQSQEGDLVIEGTITSSGGNPNGRLDFEITGEKGKPWVRIEMDMEDALEIGSVGLQGLISELRDFRKVDEG